MADLLQACNDELEQYDGTSVTERQVRADIEFMERDAGGAIPLERVRNGHRVYYRYEDPSFSINNLPITQSEYDLLTDTIQMLRRFKGMPSYIGMDTMIAKLETVFNVDKNVTSYVAFSQNEELTGLQHFTPLLEAIASKSVLMVRYHKFGGTISELTVHPYQLRQYNNRWFLVGMDDQMMDTNPLSIYPLDRIDWLTRQPAVKYIPYAGNIEDAFKDIVGVSLRRVEPINHIILRAYHPTADYIRTKPIHPSQRIIAEEKDYVEFSLDIKVNYELVTILTSYADCCEVIEPHSLRAQIRERGELIVKNNK
jgi:predicted DNA-binding transcriptional regulator YafY